MYLTVNTVFVNYLDSLDNLTVSLKAPILLNRTTYKQTVPISLIPPEFDYNLLTAPKTLKDFVHQFQQKKEIFDLQERHTDVELELHNKNYFFNNYIFDVFLFGTAIISLLVTVLVINILCKHRKLKNFSRQCCFTANKRSRCGSKTGKGQTSAKY